jgi:ABC-2 type transport system ATP-binding protein
VERLRSVEGVRGVAVEEREQAQVLVIQVDGAREVTQALLARLEGARLGRVSSREPTLEDAYVALVTQE